MAEIDVKMMEIGRPMPGMVLERKMADIVIEDYKKTYNDITSTLLLDGLNTSRFLSNNTKKLSVLMIIR